MYLLKLALRPWRIAPFSQAFAALAVGFLLLLAGFLFWMEKGLRPIVYRLQSEQVITAYLDTSVETQDEKRIVDSIRHVVGSKSIDVKMVAPQQFVKELGEHYPELSKELSNLGPETNSIIPRYVSVSGILPKTAWEQIKSIPGVESAESSKDRYHHIVGAFKALRWVSKLLAAGLCLALLTGLIHLSRMNSYLHQDALNLLRFWGAGSWTLRAPTLISGFWVGMAGGIIAFAGWSTGGIWLAKQVRNLSPMLKDITMPTVQMGLALLLIGAMIGMLAGMLGGASQK